MSEKTTATTPTITNKEVGEAGVTTSADAVVAVVAGAAVVQMVAETEEEMIFAGGVADADGGITTVPPTEIPVINKWNKFG